MVVSALVVLLAGCQAPVGSSAGADSCLVSTTTVREVYDQLRAEMEPARAVDPTNTAADTPLCAGGPTARELMDAASRARALWCQFDPAPEPILLYRVDVVLDRQVIVLDFERSPDSGYREPSEEEIAATLGVDQSIIELHRDEYSKLSRCLPA